MKTIAILSQKGGAGKSTVAINLASAAQQDGKTVIIADLDSQGSCSDWHAARLKYGSDPLPHVQAVDPSALSAFANEAERRGVDLLILDTPPKSDHEAIAAAEHADFVLMVSSPSPMDLRAVKNTIRLTKIAKLKLGVNIALVLNLMRPLGTAAHEAAIAIRQLDTTVLHYGLGNRVDFEYSLIQGQSALEYDPRGKAAQEVNNLYVLMCQHVGMPTNQQIIERSRNVAEKAKARS